YIFFIFILFLLLTSCDFIHYEKETQLDEELIEAQNTYIEELYGLSQLDNYREAEQRTYTLALQEAVNQIKDCKDKALLQGIFDENKEIILNIKLDKTYCLEEEQLKQDYIERLKQVSSLEVYLEEEQEVYLYYLNLGIEAIEQITDFDNLDSTFKAYEERILGIKTVEQYVNEWHMAFCLEIDNYVDLSIYRQAEADSISKLILESKENILDTDNYQNMDSILRDFKIKVYTYATAEELYAIELEVLKQDSIKEIQAYKSLEDYRENEQLIILKLLDTFNTLMKNIENKEEVNSITEIYKTNLDCIKTDKVLYEEERLVLVNEGYEELSSLIDKTDKTDEFIEWYTTYCQEVKEELTALSTKQEVNVRLIAAKELLYTQGAQEGDANSLRQYKNIVIERVEQYLDLSLNRKDHQIEIQTLILNWSFDLRQLQDYDAIVQEVE
ncbi:MAG: hypothetical protein K2K50_06160, partial [Anaeroplasmataceae bacterium]|nr:hypothetical protein [Anaeroplasmataceae bacterium]